MTRVRGTAGCCGRGACAGSREPGAGRAGAESPDPLSGRAPGRLAGLITGGGVGRRALGA
ncbi:hypothetical protein [Pseudactinotalea sp. HY158]|uniref:hypothetical protein n=1 Tax=Pseudactinotalea sp. HY158 TaxID=2654547 RepID=UPI00129C2836|nr:hypothetical protein [Pseudactinotalea sp. HY158]QGH68831.1 hypothetical protein GCE65_04455 [Pseudactinotalea sp. HY158]